MIVMAGNPLLCILAATFQVIFGVFSANIYIHGLKIVTMYKMHPYETLIHNMCTKGNINEGSMLLKS